ncbi:MAG: hypothetical protein ACPGVU_17315 [Limisphaerales bacterium]
MSVTAKRTFLPLLLVITVWFLPTDLSSQASLEGVGYNFSYAYYEGTSQRPSSLVLGKKTKPQSAGMLLIEGLKIISFVYGENNSVTTNVVIEAPTCLLDLEKRIASSDGRLTARAPDGTFLMEGIGFEYRQIDSQLQISNQVSTVFPRPNLNLKPAQNAK